MVATARLGFLIAPFRRFPRATGTIGCALAALALTVLAANLYIVFSTSGEATGSVADAPHAQVAIVPGAFVQPDGQMSAMLADRVSQAAALWKAGKVDRVLVSGDHHRWAYDEPDTMRAALIAQGVPPRVIFTDHAGFDTWATMERAKQIFGVRSAIVVTQGFHMPRALYLAHEAGLKAAGITSDLHGYGKQGLIGDARAILSRAKAVADVATGAGVTGGPPVPITGRASASLGPAPPPGTPPAGAPRAAHPRR